MKGGEVSKIFGRREVGEITLIIYTVGFCEYLRWKRGGATIENEA